MIEHKHPPKLDIKHAAQSPMQLVGHDTLLNYERLMQETQGQGGENSLNWSAQAEFRADQAGAMSAWLDLTVDTCLPPVSYTHLDVYKRQVKRFGAAMGAGAVQAMKSTATLR